MMWNARVTAFSSSLLLAITLVVALAATLAWDLMQDGELDRATDLREKSLALADEMRQSSNLLGRLATAYIITRDPVFKAHYDKVIAIRDGKLARPNSGRMFWDIALEHDTVPNISEQVKPVALLTLLAQLGLTEAETRKLHEAKSRSDLLTATELAAIKMVETPGADANLEHRALAMLNDADYRRAKQQIITPIGEFRALVDQRTRAAVKSAERSAATVRNASTVIAVLLVAALIRAYAVLRRVMGGSVDQVHARIAALGHGDFLNPIVVREKRRDSVMGWLSETRDKLAAGARENEDAMRQLRASETQFRQIAENIREVFFLGNLDGTQILYVSPGYEELWGRTCASLYADPDSWREAVHPEDRVKVSAAIAIGGAKGQFEYECRIIRPDETLRWIRVRAFPIRDDEGIVHRIAGFAIDTTHRTKLEVTPRDEDRRFNDVVDNLPSPCFIANARGRITYCNDAALALTGWNRVELLGRPSAEILNRVLAREGSLAATTWRHIRLSSEEGTPQGTAMLGEAALH